MFNFLKSLFGKADLNKDGKVDKADVACGVEAVQAKAAQVKTKAKAAVKKTTTRKTKTSK